MVVVGRVGTTVGKLLLVLGALHGLQIAYILGVTTVFGLGARSALLEVSYELATLAVLLVGGAFVGGYLPAAAQLRAVLAVVSPWHDSEQFSTLPFLLELLGVLLLVPGLIGLALAAELPTRYGSFVVGVVLGLDPATAAAAGVVGLLATFFGLLLYVGSWVAESFSFT